jgi:hypothetical protein
MDLNRMNKTNFLPKLESKNNIINIMNLSIQYKYKTNNYYIKNNNDKNSSINKSLKKNKNNKNNNSIIRLKLYDKKPLNLRYSIDLNKKNINKHTDYYNTFLKNFNTVRNNINATSKNNKTMSQKNFFSNINNYNNNNSQFKINNYSINKIQINNNENNKTKKLFLTPKKIFVQRNKNIFNKSKKSSGFQEIINNGMSHSQIIKKRNTKICTLCNKEIELYRFNFHYNLHPSLILPFLYLGSYRNACDKKEINDLNILYVLNCAIECYDHFPKNIKYCHVKLNDLPYFNILPYLNKSSDFIEEARKNKKNILVHCQLGISRSTSCVIAYMIKYMNYNCLDALEFIKKKRKQVMPNYGFIEQLIKFQKNLS